jgi:hypothetical protein
MANIKELIQSIESGDSSFDEKLAAINKMEETLVAMREQEKEAVDDNVELIVEAIKLMEKKVADQLEIAKSIVPEKGDKGDKGQDGLQGRDGLNGKDGRDGKNGLDGKDGEDGVSVTDAKIDFDGSLIITLSTGREINVGEVVAPDLAERLSVISTMSTNTAVANITSGTIDNTVIGGTTPAAGTFTTLTATGQTSLGGVASAEGLRVLKTTSSVNFIQASGAVTGSNPVVTGQGGDTEVGLDLGIRTGGFNFIRQRIGSTGNIDFSLNAAGSQAMRTTIASSQVNYVQVTGAATTKAVIQSSQGSDSNISFVTQTKGTGAIDLAAGSSGVNISNGGTVTAITRTVQGSLYTSVPSLAISAPTTAGGVQATATANLGVLAATIVSGGTGYTAGNTLTVVGGTGTAAQLTVSTVSSGVITAVTVAAQNGVYSVFPTSPVSVTGGTGSSATFNISGGILSTFTITNAGSGYVEQPTVTFSGGGGSGAAAYATVGSGTTVRSLGSTLSFSTPSSEVLRIVDNNPSSQNYLQLESSGAGSVFRTAGASANPSFGFVNKGTGSFYFSTSNSTGNVQFNVAHTASAVNYVQVTGSATTARPAITAQGSDTNIGLNIQTKGTGSFFFVTGGSSIAQLVVTNTASSVNYINVTGGATGVAPVVSALGNDTNIDLTLTPKGTGNVRFGTFTANMALVVQGYIEIKDSGGTVRKLAVIA